MVPEVKKCSVTQCFYNKKDECHAHAITVGSEDPVCETFIQTQSNTQKQGAGEVGACHVHQCSYNDQMFCHACDDIQVDMASGKAMCTTYRPR